MLLNPPMIPSPLLLAESAVTLGSGPLHGMTLVSDPNPEPVSPSPSKQGGQEEGHRRHRLADPSYFTPPPSTAISRVDASPEAAREDDVPAAESEDEEEWEDAADSEDEAELEAAAAELEDEAKWGATAVAESEDDTGGKADTGEPDTPPRGWPSNSARRDPRKAELFRRLDAVCEARRLQEARLLNCPPPPAETWGPYEPIWPPKSPHWRRFRELRAMKSSPANPVLNPDENSLNCPPSNKGKEMLSDKVVYQQDDTKHSSESASYQIVPYENGHGENPLPVPSKRTINTYAVQCGKCRKWRLVPTKMKYEEIRKKSRQVPFSCEHVHGWKPGVSCNDPADISQDDGFWAIDKPCLSEAPLGWERTISIRSEGSSQFADVYYIPPKGKKLRSTGDIKNYLQANPEYAAGLQPSKDWFAMPAPLQNNAKKSRRQLKPLEPNKVLPLSSAPPIHEDPRPKCVLALCDGGQYFI